MFQTFINELPRKENGKIDWMETIGSVVVAVLLFGFAYLWFKYVNFNPQ